MAVWDRSYHLEWERGGGTDFPAWHLRHLASFCLLRPNAEWVGTIHCPRFLPSDDFLHQHHKIALRNGLWWRLHLSNSTVLSWSSFFLMFWYIEHICPLPPSRNSSLASRPILQMFRNLLSVSYSALFSSFSRRSKECDNFLHLFSYLLTSAFRDFTHLHL